MSFHVGVASLVFLTTMLVIFWRPKGLNEAWPASIGAAIILVVGIVSHADIMDILNKIGGASITIMATIVMAVILESFGFFNWAAARLANLARGSGHRLYWYIQLLCFLMTLLFNNDGSILITTPILILLLKNLRLKPSQQIPYLLSGALIARPRRPRADRCGRPFRPASPVPPAPSAAAAEGCPPSAGPC